jgi:hypothetical protein
MSLVFLALFFFLSIGVAIACFPLFRMDLFQKGRPVNIRRWLLAVLLAVVAVGGALTTMSIVHSSSTVVLDRLFATVFSAGWALNALFLLPRGAGRLRLPLSVAVGAIALYFVWQWPSTTIHNIFYAGSILWVGPVLFRRFRLPLRFFVLGLALFLVYDVINILVLDTGTALSEATGRFSGLVIFGGNELGVGDFFVAYAMVNAAQYFYQSKKLAWLLGALFSLPLLALGAIPALKGVALPYTVICIPVAVCAYVFIHRRMQQRI